MGPINVHSDCVGPIVFLKSRIRFLVVVLEASATVHHVHVVSGIVVRPPEMTWSQIMTVELIGTKAGALVKK